MKSKKFLEIAIKSAKQAGLKVLSLYKKIDETKRKNKNFRDIVSEVDNISDREIKKLIQQNFPKHSFLSEESGLNQKKSNYLWIVDPLDGTVNYTKGLKLCSISISLKYKNEFILGVIYNPFSDDTFYAFKKMGAFLNGERILVSKNKELNNSLFVAAFSSDIKNNNLNEYKKFRKINTLSLGVLRLGSAAFSMSLLSNGSIDGFWAKKVKMWDVAAGICLIKEAKGIVKFKRFKNYNVDLIAGNKFLIKKMKKVLK